MKINFEDGLGNKLIVLILISGIFMISATNFFKTFFSDYVRADMPLDYILKLLLLLTLLISLPLNKIFVVLYTIIALIGIAIHLLIEGILFGTLVVINTILYLTFIIVLVREKNIINKKNMNIYNTIGNVAFVLTMFTYILHIFKFF